MAAFNEEILLLKLIADTTQLVKDFDKIDKVLKKTASSAGETEEQVKTLENILNSLPKSGTDGFTKLAELYDGGDVRLLPNESLI